MVGRLWVQPLRSSLWLDEFGTWWVTNAGLRGVVDRARLFPQSIPYAAIVCFARAFGGASEAALRLPSLAAALLAAWALYRLGRELFDRETGLLAAGLFVAFPPIAADAHDARPYAFAVLAVTVAAWMLARWSRTGGTADAASYAAAGAATVYLQYLFAAVLPAHAGWLWLSARLRRASRASESQVLGVVAAIAILTAPAAALILEIGRTGSLHAFRDAPGLRDIIVALLPQRVLGPLILSVLIVAVAAAVARAARLRLGLRLEPASRDALRLLFLWLAVPVALLAAIAWTTGVGVFDSRYVMSVVPAQALILGWLVRGLEPSGARRAVLALYLAIVLVARGLRPETAREDWRAAASLVRAENRGRPVLLGGTFVESRSVVLVRDARHASYLRAPLDYYEAGGRTLVLPLRDATAEGDAEAYAASLFEGEGLRGGFALIERSSSRHPTWSGWLEARARESGLAMRPVWEGERLKAWVFEPAMKAPLTLPSPAGRGGSEGRERLSIIRRSPFTSLRTGCAKRDPLETAA